MTESHTIGHAKAEGLLSFIVIGISKSMDHELGYVKKKCISNFTKCVENSRNICYRY